MHQQTQARPESAPAPAAPRPLWWAGRPCFLVCLSRSLRVRRGCCVFKGPVRLWVIITGLRVIRPQGSGYHICMPKIGFVALLLVAIGISRIEGQIPSFPQPQGERVDADTAISRALKTSSLTEEGTPFHAVLVIGDGKSPYS